MNNLAKQWRDLEQKNDLDLGESASRAEMMSEAVARMKMLGVSSESIKRLQNSGQLNFGMENGHIFPLENLEKRQIQMLEDNEENLVYAVVRNDSFCGKLVSYIMVSRFKSDWGLEQESIKNGNRVMAYVCNCDVPSRSEMGMISVKTIAGGMLDRWW